MSMTTSVSKLCVYHQPSNEREQRTIKMIPQEDLLGQARKLCPAQSSLATCEVVSSRSTARRGRGTRPSLRWYATTDSNYLPNTKTALPNTKLLITYEGKEGDKIWKVKGRIEDPRRGPLCKPRVAVKTSREQEKPNKTGLAPSSYLPPFLGRRPPHISDETTTCCGPPRPRPAGTRTIDGQPQPLLQQLSVAPSGRDPAERNHNVD